MLARLKRFLAFYFSWGNKSLLNFKRTNKNTSKFCISHFFYLWLFRVVFTMLKVLYLRVIGWNVGSSVNEYNIYSLKSMAN